jgi:hypothetical protein
MALRAVSPRDPAALCRDIAIPAARICYEELQVVAAQLPENFVNFVLCSHVRTAGSICYTGLSSEVGGLHLFTKLPRAKILGNLALSCVVSYYN